MFFSNVIHAYECMLIGICKTKYIHIRVVCHHGLSMGKEANYIKDELVLMMRAHSKTSSHCVGRGNPCMWVCVVR